MCHSSQAAWWELACRCAFPPLRERFERLEEILQIARHMWSGNQEAFTGRHFRLEEPITSPRPLSQPHPPMLIGGSGEKKTLRLVAQYGDACNLFARGGGPPLQAKLDVLKRHCEGIGRDYGEIEKTTLATVHIAPGKASASDVAQQCRDFAALGIQHAIFNMPNVHEITPLEVFGREVIPALVGL